MSTAVSRQVTVRNRLGLHARAASMVVRLAGAYRSDIQLEKDGVKANAKSIMGILMLAAAQGCSLIITADGDDALDAVAALATLIEEDRFNES